jgi:hypothetical protein
MNRSYRTFQSWSYKQFLNSLCLGGHTRDKSAMEPVAEPGDLAARKRHFEKGHRGSL